MIRCAVSDCAFQCELVVILIDNAKLAAVHGDQAIGLARSGLRDTEGVVETIKAALIQSDAATESIVAGQNKRTVTVLNQRSVIKTICNLGADCCGTLFVVFKTPLLSIFQTDIFILDASKVIVMFPTVLISRSCTCICQLVICQYIRDDNLTVSRSVFGRRLQPCEIFTSPLIKCDLRNVI